MVIFHSYVKLPEGSLSKPSLSNPDSNSTCKNFLARCKVSSMACMRVSAFPSLRIANFTLWTWRCASSSKKCGTVIDFDPSPFRRKTPSTISRRQLLVPSHNTIDSLDHGYSQRLLFCLFCHCWNHHLSVGLSGINRISFANPPVVQCTSSPFCVWFQSLSLLFESTRSFRKSGRGQLGIPLT